MQLINAASLLSLLVASAVADPAVPANLRSAASASASAPRDLASTTQQATAAAAATTTTKQQYASVKRGEPSYLEFYNYRGYCVGFDRKREGEEAKVVDCDHSDAAYVAYRSDRRLELYNTHYCLEEDGSSVVLYQCDKNEDRQLWSFPSQTIKNKRLYRICNEYNDYCMERNGYYVDLEQFDRNDKDQLIILDSNFFETA
jgi:Ricin-type beta-trefoil lectin domain